MATQQTHYTFLEIIRLKGTEVWESKLNHYSLVTRGDLQLLHQQAQDIVLLRIHNNNWVLNKDLQIIGTRSLRGEWQAYSIVSPGGFFCLKVTGLDFLSKPHPELINFEAILENRANFVRNTTLEARFDIFKEQQQSGLSLGNIAGNIMKAVDNLTSTLSHTDYQNHPNYLIVRPVKDLLDVDSKVVPIVDLPELEINNFRTETAMLARDYQGLGEWKALWEEGSNQRLSQGVSQMNLGQSQPQGEQQLKQGENVGDKGYHGHKQAEEGKHDGQELVGDKNQRLPSYEITNSSKYNTKGFEKAASSQQEGDNEPTGKAEEDSEFTTGLLKNNIDTKKPEADSKEQVDLPKEALNMQSWGSNVTNPSESTQSIDSDLGKGNNSKGFNVLDNKIDPNVELSRSGDSRTTMDKVSESGDNLKETAAP